MRARIDEVNCIGCGLCPQISESVFQMSGDVAEVIQDPVTESEEDNVREAAESCPTEAIIID